jgi:hypothetical protein
MPGAGTATVISLSRFLRMSTPRVRRYFALVVGILTGVACGDYSQSTSPAPVPPKLLPPTLVVSSSFSVALSGTLAEAIQWGPAHHSVDQSVSAVVGPEGGTLSLPGADFSLTIPAGALLEPTNITIVAKAGSYVVYDMFPHGLQFLQPVTAVQGLSTTASYGTPYGNSVRTAYLSEGNDQITPDGFASPAELPAVTTFFYGAEPVAETQEWILNHFSRYILISGVWVQVDDGGDDTVQSISGGALPIDPQ